MSSVFAIELAGVGLAYRVPHYRQRRVKGLPLSLLAGRRIRHERLWALRDVTLTIPRGEVVAVVGHNGAGKSTLLRLLAGVFKPMTGRVIVRGATVPLSDLGVGLDLNASATDNVELYGSLLGRSPKIMRAHAAAILEWAGLSEFADVPAGSLSSGMLARLAFSIAAAETPDVLLIDEVLGVGDAEFQERSGTRVRELATGGATVVVVSHNAEELRRIATRAVWLDHGRVLADGPIDEVLDSYLPTPAASA